MSWTAICSAGDVLEDVLELPVDFHRRPGATARLETYRFELRLPSTGPRRASGAVAREHLLLTAAFGILLSRWTGQTSVPLTTAHWTARNRMLWTLPLRLRTAANTTLRSVLAQIDGELCGRDAPPLGDAELCCPDPDRSRVGLSWCDDPRALDGPAPTEMAASAGSRDCSELQLIVSTDGTRLPAAFVYDASRFQRTSVERFAGHLQMLLAGAAGSPDAPISELPLLAPGERRWLETFCAGSPRTARGELVHERIERTAAAAPDTVALRYREHRLTYGELNRRANRLARLLIAKGIGAERRVVVCVEPGFEILVALLAIWKAGAVYVPLDPSYPPARVRTIVDDVRPALVLTQSRLAERLPVEGAVLLSLDDGAALEAFSDDDPGLAVDPEQTAHVYYTSGTTGRPKGVMASYANLVHYVGVARERYGMTSQDVVPAIARFSFSISMFELATPLSAGGTLVVLDRDHVLDVTRMADTLGEVTLFHAGPSLLRNLVPHLRRHVGALSGVRHASSGGDMVPPELLERMKDVFPNAEVFVIYGSSEISCMGCTYPVPRGRSIERTFVGRPFDDVVVRVTDAAGNLLPVGMLGEVLFAGSGVVKGYLDRPDLTEERFVTLDGRRFYRTGDVGRISEDGWLELVGRADFQVKIRGMRVELGEVEHHLRRAPGVGDGVVTARESADGEKLLVAYVVPDAPAAPAGAAERKARLRRHLVDRLPDYMVPAIYVELESLPLNHNMKVDRQALQKLSLQDSGGPEGREPATSTERALARLWSKVLGVDRVQLDDNFFELGGHSLLALTLILEVERELGVLLDGMDVLRESLEVLARISDQRLGRSTRPSPDLRAPELGSPATELFHFGPDSGLYGVLHGRSVTNPDHAVVICPPVGQEHARAHFVLGRLSRQLAARGVPVLRFDYYGCGDSLGESEEATWARWQDDVTCAYEELRRRTHAAHITAVGVRLGALLLWNTLERLDIARLVLWDPVCNASEHLAELQECHARHLRAAEHGWWRRPKRRPGTTELAGSTYSDRMLRELAERSLPPPKRPREVPVRWLASSPPARQAAHFRSLASQGVGGRFEAIDVDCSWQDAARLEDVLPDVGIAAALARMATETS